MTPATKVDLQKSYTVEERDAMLDAYGEALLRGEDEEAERILEQIPIHARWAKYIAEILGADYLRGHFNITEANRVYGEGWLDA